MSANTLQMPTSKPKPTRCEFCRKKVPSVLEMQCSKCNKKLCFSHIQCEMHECNHDHKEAGQTLLRKQLVVGTLADKLERI